MKSRPYLSSLHDLLGFSVEVEVSPQCLQQHSGPDAHLLAVDVSKLLDAAHTHTHTHEAWFLLTLYSHLVI